MGPIRKCNARGRAVSCASVLGRSMWGNGVGREEMGHAYMKSFSFIICLPDFVFIFCFQI
jgi:hypothetical protein